MNTPLKLLVVAALAVVVIGVVTLKEAKTSGAPPRVATPAARPEPAVAAPTQAGSPVVAKLPKFIDLGSDKCIPCKLMAPILAELRRDYAHAFVTEFIDVWKDREAGKAYGIEVIPTQIFHSAAGQELFRHVGFFGKEDILAKWKELGVDPGGQAEPALVREAPRQPDTRPRDRVCFMCDGPVVDQTKTTVQGLQARRVQVRG